MSVGEIQFFRDVLIRLVECDPSLLIFLIHHTVTGAQEFAAHIPGFKHPVVHLSNSALANRFLRRLDLFITTEQFVCGPPTVYTLTIFHGQPAKGITFKLHNLVR